MKPAVVERWVWILIYSGLLVLTLGLFAGRRDDALGTTLMIGGSLVALAGAVLIVVRSRMKP